jgi:hypothetical protein
MKNKLLAGIGIVWAVLVSFLLTISPVTAAYVNVLDNMHDVDIETGLPLGVEHVLNISKTDYDLSLIPGTSVGSLSVGYSSPCYLGAGIKIVVNSVRHLMFEVYVTP